MTFTGRLQLDFGDWGSSGRIAITLNDIWWGDLRIPAGTMSDGASVPRPFWWFLPPWGDRATLAAILHDYLLDRLIDGNPLPGFEGRAAIDAEFRKALLALGIHPVKAWLCWIGVRANSICFEITGWPPQRLAWKSESDGPIDHHG